MKQRKKIGKVMLSFVLSFSMILSVMMTMIPAMEVKADSLYASYVNNTATPVTFNNKSWYIIADNSESAGTVTLLAADTSFGTSAFSDNGSNAYSSSKIKSTLDALTVGNGDFAEVASAIKDTDNGKLYLLSIDEVNVLTDDVRKINFRGGDCNNCEWWLRSAGKRGDTAAFVDGVNCNVSQYGHVVNDSWGVRPALQLNLESVIFESNTFTVATPVSSISISPDTTQSVDIDSKISFTATVSPDNATDKTVKWSTSGKVTLYSDENCTTPVGSDATSTLTVYAKGVTAGDDTVTVTSNANPEKSASCNVTVNKKAGTISYTTTSVSKTNGDAAFTNVLTNTGDGAVSYASDNTAVATVNAETGEVTIQRYGEANITATVTDGDNYTYATKTASYKLTVAKRSYEVKFDSNGHGTAPVSQTVDEDSKATKPADLSSTDYDFTGWYKESACTNKWNFDTDTVTEATTIFAGWKIKTFTVTWTNYDDTVLDTDTVNYGETPEYTGDTPTKPADEQYTYTFAGWTPDIDTVTGDVTYKATYTQTEIKKDDGEKSVLTEVKKDEKSPEVKAANLTNEFAESTLSSEEKAHIDEAINNGEDVKVDVYLEIEDISDTISASDKEKIKASVTNADNIEYFDISLFKEISISGRSQGAASIHDLTTPLKLTIGVPKSFPAVADGYTRTYKVLRLHEGSVTVLPATLNSDGTLSFETDKFSTYALAYTDTKEDTSETATTTAATTATTTVAASTSDATTASAKAAAEDKTAPKTGDSMPIAVLVVLMLAAAGALAYMDLKKKKN